MIESLIYSLNANYGISAEATHPDDRAMGKYL